MQVGRKAGTWDLRAAPGTAPAGGGSAPRASGGGVLAAPVGAGGCAREGGGLSAEDAVLRWDPVCVTDNQNLKFSKNLKKKPSGNACVRDCQNFKFRKVPVHTPNHTLHTE